MVVKNDNAQVFSDYDAKHRSVLYDASQCKENVISKGPGGFAKNHTPTVFPTRYFYNTNIDKKCVQGLIARDKKQTL